MSDRTLPISEDSGGNASEGGNLPAGAELIQSTLFDVQAWLETSKEANREASEQALRIRAEAQQQTHILRMQQFLYSGDPILMAEAIAWAQINPGVLDEEALAMISLRVSAQAFRLRLQGLLPRMQALFLALLGNPLRSICDEGSRMDE